MTIHKDANGFPIEITNSEVECPRCCRKWTVTIKAESFVITHFCPCGLVWNGRWSSFYNGEIFDEDVNNNS